MEITGIQARTIHARIARALSLGWSGYETIIDNLDRSVTVVMLDKRLKKHFLRVGVDGKCAFQPLMIVIR